MKELEKMYAISGRINIKKGDILAGKYRYIKKLGMGGMGAVCLVSDIKTSEMLAMKYCLSEEHSDRFEREVLAWLQLGHHANIVSAIYFDRINDRPTLFIEYIKGLTLKEIIDKNVKERQELYFEMILDYAIQLSRGMDHLHERGIIHRDLNPNNIIIQEEENGFGIVKITDMGLSKLKVLPTKTKTTMSGRHLAVKVELTETNQVLGTPQYMSPQQYTCSKEVNESTDVYAFGLILYEMISCGKFPFEANSTTGWLHAHLYKTPRHIKKQAAMKFSFFNNKSKNELFDLVMCCLAKKNEERPQCFTVIEKRLENIYEQFCKKSYRRSKISRLDLSKWDELNNKAISLLTIGPEHVKEAKSILRNICEEKPNYVIAQLNLLLLQLKTNGLSLADFWLECREILSKVKDTYADKVMEVMVGSALEKRTYMSESLELLNSIHNLATYPNLMRKKAKWLYLKREYEKAAQYFSELCEEEWADADDFYSYSGALIQAEIQKDTCQVIPKIDKFSLAMSGDIRQKVWDILRNAEKKCGTNEQIEKSKDIIAGGEIPKMIFWHESGSLKGHNTKIYKVLVTACGRKVISVGHDKFMKIWCLVQQQEIHTFKMEEQILSIAVTLRGKYALLGFPSGKIQMYDLEKKELVDTINAHKGKVIGLGFFNDDADFISCEESGKVKHWKIENIRKKKGLLNIFGRKPYHEYSFNANVSCISMDINGDIIVAGNEQGKIFFLNRNSEKHLVSVVEAHKSDVIKILVSANNRVAVSMSSSTPHNLLLWDLKNREKIHFTQENTTSVAITGDAKYILVTTNSGFLDIWSTNKKTKLFSIEAHSCNICDISVTADAITAVSGAEDGSIKIWANNYTWPLLLEQNYLKSSGI